MKKLIVVFLLLLILQSTAAGQEWDLAAVRDTAHASIQADEELAQLLDGYSSGQITVRIRADGSLYGDESAILDALAKGDIALGQVSVSTLLDAVPGFGIFAVPYVFKNSKHLQAALNGPIGEKLSDAVNTGEYGWVVLGWYNCGGKCFYTNTQVASALDMRGLRIRCSAQEQMQALLKAMGAEPIVLGRNTVYSALMMGNLDGAENDLVTLLEMGDYEAAHYVLLDEHTFDVDVLLMSRRIYEAMDDASKDMVEFAAALAEQSEWERFLTQENAALTQLRELGCTFTYMDNGVRETFVKAAQAGDEGTSAYGMMSPETAALAEQIEKLTGYEQ